MGCLQTPLCGSRKPLILFVAKSDRRQNQKAGGWVIYRFLVILLTDNKTHEEHLK